MYKSMNQSVFSTPVYEHLSTSLLIYQLDSTDDDDYSREEPVSGGKMHNSYGLVRRINISVK